MRGFWAPTKYFKIYIFVLGPKGRLRWVPELLVASLSGQGIWGARPGCEEPSSDLPKGIREVFPHRLPVSSGPRGSKFTTSPGSLSKLPSASTGVNAELVFLKKKRSFAQPFRHDAAKLQFPSVRRLSASHIPPIPCLDLVTL